MEEGKDVVCVRFLKRYYRKEKKRELSSSRGVCVTKMDPFFLWLVWIESAFEVDSFLERSVFLVHTNVLFGKSARKFLKCGESIKENNNTLIVEG